MSVEELPVKGHYSFLWERDSSGGSGGGCLLVSPQTLGVASIAQPSPSVYSPVISTPAGTRLRWLVHAKSLFHYGISEMPITMQFLNACLQKDDV